MKWLICLAALACLGTPAYADAPTPSTEPIMVTRLPALDSLAGGKIFWLCDDRGSALVCNRGNLFVKACTGTVCQWQPAGSAPEHRGVTAPMQMQMTAPAYAPPQPGYNETPRYYQAAQTAYANPAQPPYWQQSAFQLANKMIDSHTAIEVQKARSHRSYTSYRRNENITIKKTCVAGQC